ncbi:MAG: CBS domain-containing protein [Gemmatimonadales bacterium]
MLASAVMISDPIVAAAGATSAEVAALMRSRNISVVPVIDDPKGRRYLGTVSDRDIVTQCVALGHDPTECSAQDHMRTDTPVVTPATELAGYELSKQLDAADHHVRSTIVVIDEDRRVVGFIPHPEEVAGVVIR